MRTLQTGVGILTSGSFIPTLRCHSGFCPDLVFYSCISADRCRSKCAPPTVRASVGGHCSDPRFPVGAVSYGELRRFRSKNAPFSSYLYLFSALFSRAGESRRLYGAREEHSPQLRRTLTFGAEVDEHFEPPTEVHQERWRPGELLGRGRTGGRADQPSGGFGL